MIRYDGLDADELRARLHVPRVALFDHVGSTMDVAHELAGDGAPVGTVVLADEQLAGRGRLGRSWRSAAGAGIWLTVIERPRDASGLDLLPLRIGIALAPALDAYANAKVTLKWPNDLFVGRAKLAGVLTEARWRGERLEWVAIGAGINVRAPEGEVAAGLAAGTRRLDVLDAAVHAIREASARRGPLSTDELSSFAGRDRAVGRECVDPVRGRVCGIDASGALMVELGSGVVAVRSGSLVLKEGQ
jgi:BirA family biotin operon repressor/biotin-[acetyl-CoA-carboxylase] ligase